ncbi:hypothetical protein JW707_03590 [Candidatus Woesearchaeota archaeon]|nr:hypothetical protein [Candidatus Woesearchaeota archaeon]
MTIIATNFTKISVEKSGAVKGKVSIANNVVIKDVVVTDIAIGASKQNALKFSFEFTAKYEPKIGQIVLNGDLIFLEKADKIKEIAESWKKSKNIPKEVMAPVLNNVLTKCNVEALILSREINLPPPIQLPKVNVKK